jgi:putative DNA primase/helicase
MRNSFYHSEALWGASASASLTELFPTDHRVAARALGGEVSGGAILCPGPSHSRRDRSLRVWPSPEAPDGFRVHSFAGDDPLACRDYVRQVLGLAPWQPTRQIAQKRQQALRSEEPDLDLARRIANAVAIWEQTVDLCGTLAEDYFRSRGLVLDAELDDVVRFHSETTTVVALYRDIHTDEPCGIHRTLLDRHGRKIGRKMLGRAKCAAVKLDGATDVVLGLNIGEGIETGLTARQEGFQPTWVLGSAGAIAVFPALAGLEAITIFAEHDDSGANRRACDACAARYVAAGCEALVIDPRAGDLNDVADRVDHERD